ncbi:neoverrucotoxin subunit alpha-like [Alosa pseudoharengus]|uniref:neoverrucotoxin subunit alpha-like n=1 Tax=Alosa pseudoharengus TaxID=34774 RepID=UPI003F897D32
MADPLDLLLGVLDDLRSAELRRFRLYLSSAQLDGYPRVPQGRLESDDPTDIACKMREAYGIADSLKVAKVIMRRIHRSDLAERLGQNLDGASTSAQFSPAQRRFTDVRQYACDLTLDPNTAPSRLLLSEGSRRVENFTGRSNFSYLPHPERFESCCPQVLCCEALTGRHYWEVTYNDRNVLIGVAYRSIDRRAHCPDHVVGKNDKSWSIWCGDGGQFIAKHNNIYTDIDIEPSPSRRIGVYLDWPSGVLSFYRVSSDTLTHLHTFRATFTEPLYPGFCVYCAGSVLSLCQV